MGLEFGVEFVFASLLLRRKLVGRREKEIEVESGSYSFVALKQYDSSSLVASSEVVARVIEFNGRYYVGFSDIFNLSLVAEALCKLPRRRGLLSFHHLSWPSNPYNGMECDK